MSPENDQNSSTGELGLSGHLRELRSRLIKSLMSLAPAFVLAYSLAGPILDFLARPLREALPEGSRLVATALPETFIVHLKIGFWGGVFLSSPIWLYQFWAFVSPGLYGREKRNLRRLSFFGAILMFSGAAFAYGLIMPIVFQFFISVAGDDITLLPAVSQYLSLTIALMAAFGLCFQLPLVLLFLSSLGLVDAVKLRQFRRYAIVLSFVAGAALTPPDVISQILLALPLLGLYELSIFLISRRTAAQGDEA